MNELLREKVRDSIHFDSERRSTDVNCYAFAVGIDMDERDICEYAFNPGQIGTYLNYYDNSRNYQTMMAYMFSRPIEDRVGFDMETLGIEFSDASEDELSEYVDEEGYYNWLIAMYKTRPRFLVPSDIHCLRKNHDGIWVHKLGRDGNPSMIDPNGEVITVLPEELVYDKRKIYTSPSVYKLRMKR